MSHDQFFFQEIKSCRMRQSTTIISSPDCKVIWIANVALEHSQLILVVVAFRAALFVLQFRKAIFDFRQQVFECMKFKWTHTQSLFGQSDVRFFGRFQVLSDIYARVVFSHMNVNVLPQVPTLRSVFVDGFFNGVHHRQQCFELNHPKTDAFFRWYFFSVAEFILSKIKSRFPLPFGDFNISPISQRFEKTHVHRSYFVEC